MRSLRMTVCGGEGLARPYPLVQARRGRFHVAAQERDALCHECLGAVELLSEPREALHGHTRLGRVILGARNG